MGKARQQAGMIPRTGSKELGAHISKHKEEAERENLKR